MNVKRHIEQPPEAPGSPVEPLHIEERRKKNATKVPAPYILSVCFFTNFIFFWCNDRFCFFVLPSPFSLFPFLQKTGDGKRNLGYDCQAIFVIGDLAIIVRDEGRGRAFALRFRGKGGQPGESEEFACLRC